VKPDVRLRALAAFLVIVALAALVIGGHDLRLSPVSFGVTGSAAALVAFSVVLVLAARELVRLGQNRAGPIDLTQAAARPPFANRPCPRVVQIALVATMVVGVYVFVSALRASSDQGAIVLAVGLVLAWVPLAGWFYIRRQRRFKFARFGGIALGLVTTIVGVSEFWFQNQYVPSRAGRAVALVADIKRVGTKGDEDIIRATIDYKDIGRSVQAIGSTYTLTGSRVIRCARSATAQRVGSYFRGALTDPQRTRFMADVWETRPANVLAAGKFVRDGKRLDPDVPARSNFVFLVPRRRYQLLRFRAQLFAVPASIPLGRRALPQYFTLPNDNNVYGVWHIDDDSWLHDLISGRDRWVLLRYELVTPGRENTTTVSPDLRVTAVFPAPRWAEGSPSATYIRRQFAQPTRNFADNAGEAFADSELALGGATEPSGSDLGPRSCETTR